MSSCVKGRPRAPPPRVSSPFVLVACRSPILCSRTTNVPVSCWAAFHLGHQPRTSVGGGGRRQVSGLQEGSLPGVSPPEVAGGFIYQAPGIALLGLSWQETGVEGKGSERSSTPPATAAAP